MSCSDERLSSSTHSNGCHANASSERKSSSREEESETCSRIILEETKSVLDDEYFRPLKKLRMVDSRLVTSKSCTSFLIEDILGPAATIVRPWDRGAPTRRPRSADDDSRSESDDSSTSPLDALLQMTSKAFGGGGSSDPKPADPAGDPLNLFSNRQPARKKRKSRTAFTNHQIFELEKRFLYQKYLSPADRDEIAQALGLTSAQVITWFQNRRAKLKRDAEELRKDLEHEDARIGETTKN